MGYDAFATIQAGINGVANPGNVIVYDGLYVENPNVNKALNCTIRPSCSNDGCNHWEPYVVLMVELALPLNRL